MAGDEHDHDHEDRIADAIRHLAGDDRELDAPPPQLWDRIAGAFDDAAEAAAAPRDRAVPPPPPDLWDRIAGEVAALGGDPDATPEPDRVPSGGRAASAEEPPPDRIGPARLRRWPALLGAAAAVLLAVVVVAVSTDRADHGPPVEVVARASLTGAGLDPGGSSTGSAQLRRADGTWEVAIRARDLPTPQPGTYYEAWLLGSSPDDVQSLGALEGSDGFVVPEGLDLDDFPLVDVSIEPIDGNPAHSAKSVLRGRLEPG